MQVNKKFEKWRYLMMEYLLFVALLVFVLEIIVFLYFSYYDYLISTPQVYLVKYTLLPTFLNITTLAVGYTFLKKDTVSEDAKDQVPFFCIIAFCLVIATVHNLFYITSSIFMIPVMLSSMCGKRKVTTKVFWVSAVALFINALFPGFDAVRHNTKMWYINIVIAFILLMVAYVMSMIMIKYLQEKEKELMNYIKEKYTLEEALKRDQLTGLYNHTEFYRYLEKKIGELELLGKYDGINRMCLVVIDIDNFKNVNDQFGHEHGNIILVELSNIMKKHCENIGHVYRYGGEEFAIIFPHMGKTEVFRYVELIRKEFGREAFIENEYITISSGIVEYELGDTPRGLFEKADEAMYRAKDTGRNQTVVYS